MTDPLITQLAERTQKFKETTGLTFREIGKLAKISEQQLCDLLAGRKGLSTKSTYRLLQVVNATPAQLQAKFAKLAGKVIHLEHLQHMGEEMQLADHGSGWVSREADCAADPNNWGDDITGVSKVNGDPSDGRIIDVLRQVDNLHAQARTAIADYITKIQKARPNASGTTGPARSVPTNKISRTAGSRGDMLCSPEKLKEHLEFVRRERIKAQEQLKLQQELKEERKLYWDTKSEVLRTA